MSNEILASIVTFVVAIVSLIAAILSARVSRKTAAKLEALKFELEEKKTSRVFGDENLKRLFQFRAPFAHPRSAFI